VGIGFGLSNFVSLHMVQGCLGFARVDWGWCSGWYVRVHFHSVIVLCL
jgi:hypothetical protein